MRGSNSTDDELEARERQRARDLESTQHFNGLSPEVAELLAILAEECAEIVHRIAKILRHGLRVDPYGGRHNRETLEEEIGDAWAIVNLLGKLGVVDRDTIRDLSLMKLNKLRRPGILHHSSLLKPNACVFCGSRERMQRGHGGSEYYVECIDKEACAEQVRRDREEEQLRVSQSILSGDAW